MTPQSTLNIGPQSLADRDPGDPVISGAQDSQDLIKQHALERERMGRVLMLKPDMEASRSLNADLSELERIAGVEVEGASVRGTDRHTDKQVIYTVRPGGEFGPSEKRYLALAELPESAARIIADRDRARKLEQVVDQSQAAAIAAAQGSHAAALEAENDRLRTELAAAENARLKAELAATRPSALGAGSVAEGAEFPVIESPSASPDTGAAADKPEVAPKPRAKRGGS